MAEYGQIMLTADDGSEESFFVLEKAELTGISYLLVTDSLDDEEADALILKEGTADDMVTYEVVDDDNELRIVSKYFEELLDDIDIKVE